jgi:hypothetical protein
MPFNKNGILLCFLLRDLGRVERDLSEKIYNTSAQAPMLHCFTMYHKNITQKLSAEKKRETTRQPLKFSSFHSYILYTQQHHIALLAEIYKSIREKDIKGL